MAGASDVAVHVCYAKVQVGTLVHIAGAAGSLTALGFHFDDVEDFLLIRAYPGHPPHLERFVLRLYGSLPAPVAERETAMVLEFLADYKALYSASLDMYLFDDDATSRLATKYMPLRRRRTHVQLNGDTLWG